MKMIEPEVIFRPKASNSIDKITIYIAQKGNPQRAEKFTEKLIGFGYSLAILPKKYPICKQRSLAKRKMRYAVFQRYYIFIYKLMGNTLVIYNVIHGKTNSSHFSI